MTSKPLSKKQLEALIFELQRRREKELKADLGKLLTEPWGRRLAYALIYDFCRMEAPSFDHNALDGHRASANMMYNEGVRGVGFALSSALLDANHDGYCKMMTDERRMRAQDLSQQRAAEKTLQEADVNDHESPDTT